MLLIINYLKIYTNNKNFNLFYYYIVLYCVYLCNIMSIINYFVIIMYLGDLIFFFDYKNYIKIF